MRLGEDGFLGSKEQKLFFVYVDHTADTYRTFYIGKGKKKRVQDKERNVVWKRIAEKHGWNRDEHREVVFVTKDENAAFELEKELIAQYKTFVNGDPECWGANLTEGGEGAQGYTLTKAQKEHLRLLNTGPNNPNWGVKGDAHWRTGKPGPNRGRRFSSEWKEKLAAKKRGTSNLNARINYEIACSIRELYATGEFTHAELASRFNVSKTVIHQVTNYITWRPEHNEVST